MEVGLRILNITAQAGLGSADSSKTPLCAEKRRRDEINVFEQELKQVKSCMLISCSQRNNLPLKAGRGKYQNDCNGTQIGLIVSETLLKAAV